MEDIEVEEIVLRVLEKTLEHRYCYHCQREVTMVKFEAGGQVLHRCLNCLGVFS